MRGQRDVHPRHESCKFPLCHKTTFVPEFRVLFSVDWTLRHDSPRFGPWNGLKSPRHYLRTTELISATLSSTSIHLSLCLARRPNFTSSTCLFDVLLAHSHTFTVHYVPATSPPHRRPRQQRHISCLDSCPRPSPRLSPQTLFSSAFWEHFLRVNQTGYGASECCPPPSSHPHTICESLPDFLYFC